MSSWPTPPPFPVWRNPEARKKVTRSEVSPAPDGPVVNGSTLRGRISGLFQQFAAGSFGVGFVCAAGFVPDNSGRKFDRACVDRNTVLLHEQKLLFFGNRDNDGGTGCVDAVHVFPVALFDQSEELAGMEGGSIGVDSFDFQ